ncbi:shikimate dehydrogenase [Vulcanisaeta sp. EB80]|uniref:shikimate dehydrogenase n=1 Tax=Vulcanisaeta sp. EB80 TaxID=1650660 RepID=UPI0009BF7AE9|nr:shikimate dehydrogenase [Vulcanisaeta sp. EB80]PLC68769.1 shikimate dehydrogenase [Vulcanisaeta sp. EB80]
MQVYSVIGYPLTYTLSPVIHNYVFKALGKDAIYVPLKVSPGRLKHFIEFARDALSGFNVTMPHKVPIVDLLDDTVGAARVLGSVNTVINRDGELIGYNTDYEAVKQALMNRGYSGEDSLIIGAGGVARAVVLALADLGCGRIYVANRTVSKAEELCSLANSLGMDCKALGIGNVSIKAWLLINATPLGISEEFPIDPVRTGANLILDLAYTVNGDTSLIKLAKRHSIRYIDGLEILVRQALEADKIWFGPFEKPTWNEVFSELNKQCALTSSLS